MTLLNDRPVATGPDPDGMTTADPTRRKFGRTMVKWITSTDHKVIGYMYLITSFVVLPLRRRHGADDPRRARAARACSSVSNEQYNQLFTMHGTIMLLLFATPLFAGFANAIMPLQIGAPDVAFPRLNVLAFWFFVFGGVIVCIGFLTPGGAASLRLVRLLAAVRRDQLARTSAPTCGSSASPSVAWARSSARSTSSPRSSACARPA